MKWGLYNRQMGNWSRAYQEGVDAAERGLSFHQNPYKAGSVNHDGWSRGWKAINYNRKVRYGS